MESLSRDTTADKVFRFVIGAVLGAIGGCRSVMEPGTADGIYGWATLVGALAFGLLAVLFGNGIIEKFINGKWWS
jgi:hypothetical protein